MGKLTTAIKVSKLLAVVNGPASQTSHPAAMRLRRVQTLDMHYMAGFLSSQPNKELNGVKQSKQVTGGETCTNTDHSEPATSCSLFLQGYHRPNHFIATQGEVQLCIRVCVCVYIYICS